jgi:hypothetical protein
MLTVLPQPLLSGEQMQTQVSSLAQTLLVLRPVEQPQLLLIQVKTLFLIQQAQLLYRLEQQHNDPEVQLLGCCDTTQQNQNTKCIHPLDGIFLYPQAIHTTLIILWLLVAVVVVRLAVAEVLAVRLVDLEQEQVFLYLVVQLIRLQLALAVRLA